MDDLVEDIKATMADPLKARGNVRITHSDFSNHTQSKHTHTQNGTMRKRILRIFETSLVHFGWTRRNSGAERGGNKKLKALEEMIYDQDLLRISSRARQ